MAKGLYFYKLVSPYEEDVTKNCKLTVNEIDSNFLTLKDEDIKTAELDEETYSVILTRYNGDKLVVDLTPILSGSVYDLEVVYENPSSEESGACKGANIYITYSTLTSGDVKTTVTVPINGLVTTNNLDAIIGGDIMKRVISDGTLTGNGTLASPLGISETEKNRPAIALVDITKGEKLPEATTRGTRYITKEYTSEFGYLYNYDAVAKIQADLNKEGKGWRVPTKEDWDCLLNSIEPCDYRDHASSACHQIYGKYAGKKLKSTCGWLGEPDCECKNTVPYPGQHCDDPGTGDTESDIFDVDELKEEPETVKVNECDGIDEFGMRFLPTGWGDEKRRIFDENDITSFWTTTHVYGDFGQDIYVKIFKSDVCGVIQEAHCPGQLNSIRLVKDYDGENHHETESIDGDSYNTILFPDCNAIWTASNFASTKEKYNPAKTIFSESTYKRVRYYVNVWNGTEWEKRALTEGETVVIMEGNPYCQYNIEYRVYSEDGCNQILVNTDDTVYQRVLDKVLPLIEEERDERISADTELWEALNEEISARTEADAIEKEEREAADAILQEQIEAEALRAMDVEQQLWDAINKEAEAREEVDQQLWEAIEQEASARTEVDNQLWEAINNETERAQEVEAELWEGIAEEASARTEVDNQLWAAIEEEARIREEIDNQQWAAIEEEARIREEIDNQQWEAINNEIARAKAREDEIDGQLIDWSLNPFVLNVNDENGLKLPSKDGIEEHFINIKISSDFGTF